MKSRILCALLALVLSASLAACSGNSDGANTGMPTDAPPSPVSTGENTETETPDGDPAMEAYEAVLLNNAEFFSTDNDKSLLLNDFLTNGELYGAAFTATRFALLDLDGDGASEVVLELTVNGFPEFYEVLRYADGAVYGYNIVYRGLEELKADGTFYYSNGAADYGYGRLKFRPDAYETDVLAYAESGQGGGATTISYFIGGDPVTQEAFNAFAEEQDGKSGAVWHAFSQENVEAELAGNP